MKQLEKLNYHVMNLTLKIREFFNNISLYKSWTTSVTIFEKKYDILTIVNPGNLSIGGYFCNHTKTLIFTIPFLEISIGNREVAITNFINLYMECLPETSDEECEGCSPTTIDYDCEFEGQKQVKNKKKTSKTKPRKVHVEPTPIQTELKLGKTKSKKKFKK